MAMKIYVLNGTPGATGMVTFKDIKTSGPTDLFVVVWHDPTKKRSFSVAYSNQYPEALSYHFTLAKAMKRAHLMSRYEIKVDPDNPKSITHVSGPY